MKEAYEKLGEIVLVVHLYFHTHESLLDGSQIHLFGVLLPVLLYYSHIGKKFHISISTFSCLFLSKISHFKWIWKLNGHWDKSSTLLLCSKLSTHHVSILSVFGLAFGSHPKLEKNWTLIEKLSYSTLYNLSTFTTQL